MDRFGGADVLHLAERPKPEPKPGEILIRTRCVGVNRIDALTRAGKGVSVEGFPAIVGWDLAGTVLTLGAGVNRFRVGDAVFGMPRFPRLAEAYAEYVSAPAHELALKWEDPFDLLPQIDTCILGRKMYPGYEQYWRAILTNPGGILPFTGKVASKGEIDYVHFAEKSPHLVAQRSASAEECYGRRS